MTVLEVIRKRYSCRAYKDKPIEPEKLEKIFEAARLAPSAKNLQDWRFVAVTNKETKRKLVEAANNQKFLEKAGVILIACSNCNEVMRCGQAIGTIDVAIALEHIALQATELGLATCWIGSFYPEKVKPIVGIPQDIAIIELMAIGYPADSQKEPKRKPMKNILCYEKWNF
ncbi:MAG: nitroreductase [Planctomycetes bacterium RBG_13_44_8b]|nr:MAG: nitroreductase [Planctomycetes bacterium RBG_13_44_8b]